MKKLRSSSHPLGETTGNPAGPSRDFGNFLAERAPELHLIQAADLTGSTSRVVQGFRGAMAQIVDHVNAKVATYDAPINITHGYATMSGRGIEISDNSNLIEARNSGAESDVPRMILEHFEQSKLGAQNVMFVYGDEIDCPQDGVNHDPEELATAIEKLRAEEIHLIFVYAKTERAGQSRDEIVEMLIDPLGEFGHLVDFSDQLDVKVLPEQLVTITEATVAFLVETKLLPKDVGDDDGASITLEEIIRKRLGARSSVTLIGGQKDS